MVILKEKRIFELIQCALISNDNRSTDKKTDKSINK